MKRILLTAIIIFLFTLCACSNLSTDSDVTFDDVAIPENEILAITRQVNYAWGYQDYGWFLTSDGAVYSFDFSQGVNIIEPDNPDEVFTNKINMVMEHTEPFATIDEADLRKLYSFVLKVNCNETYETEGTACDAGIQTLHFYNATEDKMILCRQWGDLSGELTSKEAKRLLKYFDNSLLPLISEAKETNPAPEFYVYTDADVNLYNSHCGYTDAAGRYVIQNEQDIKNLKDLTGIDLYTYPWDGWFPSEDYVYLVEIIDVPTMGYDLKANGVMVKNGEISFLMDSDNQTPQEDEVYEEAMDGFCFVAELPVWAICTSYDEETDSYEFADWNTP